MMIMTKIVTTIVIVKNNIDYDENYDHDGNDA